MIQYGSTEVRELRFAVMKPFIDLRDEQWIDVEIHLGLEPGNEAAMPDDITELSALLICTYAGAIAQIVPQDEGRDCEYQFTEDEKGQLRRFYESDVLPKLQAKVQQLQS